VHGTQGRAEAAITLSTEQGFPQWLAIGAILRGWALAAQGQGEEGIAQMRGGLAAYQATGAEQGKQAEAHQMLSKIYNWFTEGFDTKDLQEAKTMLEELT
jgi:predicted ATPase